MLRMFIGKFAKASIADLIGKSRPKLQGILSVAGGAILTKKFVLRNVDNSHRMAAGVTEKDQPEMSNHGGDDFILTYSAKMEDTITVSKYKSKRTGITVCLGEVEGPTVNGYLCLATEAHDDDGLPHTLEHLIFLGSEDYPYKGVLDLVANRCMASGTNAWTATDHTCYTVTTAGAEGFLNFLPLYLDHILYPTLMDSGFVTEVHHINGEGEDAGVVYCEMQAVENNDDNRTARAMLHALYPGRCGYKSETGGILKNLRESTSNVKVRNYHKEFYRPENLCIIVSGQVSASSIFKALQPIEEKILSKGLQSDYRRPWQEPVPPLVGTVNEVVPYPSDDEDTGLVYVAWRGPKSSCLYELVALDALLLYLTDTAIAPLQREFVEIDDPYCNNVSHSIVEYSEGFIQLTFDNVLKSKLGDIEQKLLEVLKKIQEKAEPLDMQRFGSVIHRKILGILSGMESEPHDSVVQRLIEDFLHGTGNKNLQERLNQVKSLEELKNAKETFWLDLLDKYFLKPHHVTIIGDPSVDCMQKMTTEEKNRITVQRDELGSAGLKTKASELQTATEKNDVSPPSNMIASFRVPSIDSVRFHAISRFSNHLESVPDTNPSFPLSDLPFRFQLDNIHSKFVMLHAVMDTSSVPQGLKLFMPVFLEVIFESPVVREGVVIPHEAIIKELAEDTVDTSASLGLNAGDSRFTCGEVAQAVHLYLEVEISKYEKGVQWLRELLYATKFTEERVKIIATKMVSDVPQLKRKGHYIVSCLASELCYAKESNHRINNLMRQYTFLNSLLDKLKSSPNQVLEALENVRAVLTSCNNLTIHVATDVTKLAGTVDDPSAVWKRQFGWMTCGDPTAIQSLDVPPCHKLLIPFDQSLALSAVVGVGSVESAFLVQYAPCLNNSTHPDLPVIMVLLKYLTQLEGPMWRQIRGLGLSYGYWSDVDPIKGVVCLALDRSAQLLNAYKEAVVIMKSHLSGSQQWEESLIESARSSLMYSIVQQEDTLQALSLHSLSLYLNKLDQDYNKRLLKQVSEVTVEDLKRVGPKYITPLFDASKSWMAICCHPSKCDELAAGLKEYSRETMIVNLENSFMDNVENEDSPWEANVAS